MVERLGRVQVDPTSAVERAERLTLWSRFGAYDRDDLRRLLEESPRQLFEYRAFLVPLSDLPLQRPAMLRYPRNDYGRGNYVGEWLRDNAGFRAYVLDELRRRGPLLTRDLDDRAEVPWQTGGWNDGKNLGRMLEILWNGGQIAISRREGTQRVWDLWEHVLPEADELPDPVVAVELLDRQLRARGFDRTGWGGALEAGELPFRARGGGVPAGRWRGGSGGDRPAARGVACPRRRAGRAGRRRLAAAHHAARPVRSAGRGPRPRAELFDFRFKLEIYIPVAKREFGYYVLPILHGDRLIGRIDPVMDRKRGVFTVNAVYAEPDAPADAWPAVSAAIHELGTWLGASEVRLPPLPPVWDR